MRIPYRSGAVVLLSAGLAAGACGDDEEGGGSLPPPAPPEIRVVEVVPSPGVLWRPGDPLPLTLGCERRVLVNVGPQANGQLANWTLRPPRACGGIPNCGYIVASLLDAAGERLYGTEAAMASPIVHLSGGTPEEVRRLRVELYDGTTEMPFMNPEGGAAADEIDLELATATDCAGGAGGAGGAEGGAGGGPAEGGAAGRAGGSPQGGAGQGGQGGA
jgi:hypothetical protein